MADESYSFSTARTRLEEIVSQVRKKDTSLEKSLDLLEEGVRLANACTELIDHQDWVGPVTSEAGGESPAAGSEPVDAPAAELAVTDAATGAPDEDETIVVDGVAVIDDVVISDDDGNFVAEVIEVSEYVVADDFEDADDAWAEESPAENPEDAGDPSSAEG